MASLWIFTRGKENAEHCFNDETVNQSIRECDAMMDISPTRETVRETRSPFEQIEANRLDRLK